MEANLTTALATLGEKINAQSETIRYKDMLINELEQRLAEAQKKIEELDNF